MAYFTKPLTATKITGRTWQVEVPFIYYSDEGDMVGVPSGFISDLASVPRPLWSFFPPDGTYSQAAVLHDFCCEKKLFPRIKTDYIFYEAMGVLGVPHWRRWLMWRAVRVWSYF